MTINGCEAGYKTGHCNARPDFWVRGDGTNVLTCGKHLAHVIRTFKKSTQPTVVTVKVRNPAATGDRWI